MSPLATLHVQNPRNRGELPGATHCGTGGEPGEGPYVRIWLIVKDETIRHATYDSHGCPASVAAGSVLCQIVTGRTPEQAALLTAPDLLLVLGGLPEGKEHFADLAVQALRNAIQEN
ncbi:MAG: iron-sulfur cluster assembly scaffold protein [Armatimonadetes bacterium]|nr:iron-sulfur cluster assembly scaffold protein [Armatimonadota bacterium]